MLRRAHETARQVLEGQRYRLEALASRLLATETVEGPELERLLARVGADPAPAPRSGQREVTGAEVPMTAGRVSGPSLAGPTGAAEGGSGRPA